MPCSRANCLLLWRPGRTTHVHCSYPDFPARLGIWPSSQWFDSLTFSYTIHHTHMIQKIISFSSWSSNISTFIKITVTWNPCFHIMLVSVFVFVSDIYDAKREKHRGKDSTEAFSFSAETLTTPSIHHRTPAPRGAQKHAHSMLWHKTRCLYWIVNAI